MRHVALLAAFVVLVSVALGATGVMAGQPAEFAASNATDGTPRLGAGDGSPTEANAASLVGAPRTNFTIGLRETGDARWTVETQIPLDGEADRDAFREYAQAYETGNAETGPSVSTFRNAAAAASNATGREMAIEAVNYTAALENGTGVLRLRFTWTSFLRQTDSGALVLGDAFRTPNNGTWFGSLSASQRLVIEPPANYEVSDVSQGFSYSISNRRIVADGPQQFDPDDIAVRYEPGGVSPNGQQLPTELLVGGAVLLFVVLGALMMRRGDTESGSSVNVPGTDDGSGSDEASPPSSAVGERTPSDAEDPDTGTTSGDSAESTDPDSGSSPAAGAAAADDDTEEPTEEDLELLSDEERVERLLERNGGRMRQANIVSGTGWSDAKVSQLLSAMADEGRIEKLRLGRENLISLADDADDDTEADTTSDR